jgi:acyl dehydratase
MLLSGVVEGRQTRLRNDMSFDYAKVRRWPIAPVIQQYTLRDTILYALGVGVATSNPVNPDDLKFVYEEGLATLPTMAVVLATGPFWMQDPATGIDWRKILHGEQMLTLHKRLPAQGTVVGEAAVDEIYDKGAEKGAVMYLTRKIFDQATGELLATVGSSCFMRGNGGFGGQSEGAPKPHSLPADRPAELVLDFPTRPEQAAIYRLSGDYNSLHIDPSVARAGGFDRPILHGLCSYGIVGRAVLKLVCGNDPARLRRLDVRFASPVFPGETIRTELWREGAGRAAFRARVVERDVVILNNGYAEYEQ